MAKAARIKQVEAGEIEAPPAPARPVRLPRLLLLVDNDAPDEPMPWHHELLEQKRHDEALAVCDEMLARGEGRPGFIECVRALAFMELGQHDAALKAADCAVALEPKRAITHIIRGDMLISKGRMDEAWQAAEQALKIEPHNAIAYVNATSILMFREPVTPNDPFRKSLEDFSQALPLIERALALDSSQFQALAMRGEILFHLGRFEDAVSALNEARARGHDYKEDMRADALFELGRPEEAVEIYERLTAAHGDKYSHDGVLYESKLKRYRESVVDRSAVVVSRKGKVYIEGSPTPEAPVTPALPMGETAEQLSVVAKSGLSAAELQEAIDNYKAAKAQFTARGKPSRAKAKPRAKLNARDLSGPQVVAVIEDSTLGRLHRRYTELLATVELPPDGLKNLKQAQAAARLASTYEGLQRRREKLGLEPLAKDERVTEAQRLKSTFYRHNSTPSARRASLG